MGDFQLPSIDSIIDGLLSGSMNRTRAQWYLLRHLQDVKETEACRSRELITQLRGDLHAMRVFHKHELEAINSSDSGVK